MWKLEKEIRFEAAHKLPKHDGKCARLHGHSYRAVLVLESESLVEGGPKSGMVQDYADIEAATAMLLEDVLDHRYLNETMNTEDTTSENVARYIYCYLKPLLPLLMAVRLHETCTASTEYRPLGNAIPDAVVAWLLGKETRVRTEPTAPPETGHP